MIGDGNVYREGDHVQQLDFEVGMVDGEQEIVEVRAIFKDGRPTERVHSYRAAIDIGWIVFVCVVHKLEVLHYSYDGTMLARCTAEGCEEFTMAGIIADVDYLVALQEWHQAVKEMA